MAIEKKQRIEEAENAVDMAFATLEENKSESDPVDDDYGTLKHYEEWRVEIVNYQPLKVKLLRPLVKITEEHAEVLNQGAIGQGNSNYQIMYFLS